MSLIRKPNPNLEQNIEHKSDKVLKAFVECEAVNRYWPVSAKFRAKAFRIYNRLYTAGDILDGCMVIEKDLEEFLDEPVLNQYLAYRIMRAPLAHAFAFRNVEFLLDNKEAVKNIVERMDAAIAKHEGSLPETFFGEDYCLPEDIAQENFPQLTFRDVISFIRLYVEIAVEILSDIAMWWVDSVDCTLPLSRVETQYDVELGEEDADTTAAIISIFDGYEDEINPIFVSLQEKKASN